MLVPSQGGKACYIEHQRDGSVAEDGRSEHALSSDPEASLQWLEHHRFLRKHLIDVEGDQPYRRTDDDGDDLIRRLARGLCAEEVRWLQERHGPLR